MNTEERLVADYAGMGLTLDKHPMYHRRSELRCQNVRSTAELKHCRDGERVRTAGCVIARQRPGTAKGFIFISIEDEAGIANIIVSPDLYERLCGHPQQILTRRWMSSKPGWCYPCKGHPVRNLGRWHVRNAIARFSLRTRRAGSCPCAFISNIPPSKSVRKWETRSTHKRQPAAESVITRSGARVLSHRVGRISTPLKGMPGLFISS